MGCRIGKGRRVLLYYTAATDSDSSRARLLSEDLCFLEPICLSSCAGMHNEMMLVCVDAGGAVCILR